MLLFFSCCIFYVSLPHLSHWSLATSVGKALVFEKEVQRIELSSGFKFESVWVWPDLQSKTEPESLTSVGLEFTDIPYGSVWWINTPKFSSVRKGVKSTKPPQQSWKRDKLQLRSVANPSYKATHRTHFPNLWLLLVLNLFRSRLEM